MLSWLFYDPMFSYPYGPGMGGLTNPPLREPTERDPSIEARLHSLEIACAGLWELLKQKNNYSDQELIAAIKAVDDRNTSQANLTKCPVCGHPMLTHNHAKCLWCGADLQAKPFVPPAS